MLQAAICLSFYCSMTAPKPSLEMSVEIFVGFDGSINMKNGSAVTVSFNVFHSVLCQAVHSETVLCCSNSSRHAVLSASLGMNLPRKLIIPMTLSTPFWQWEQACPLWLAPLIGRVPLLHLWSGTLPLHKWQGSRVNRVWDFMCICMWLFFQWSTSPGKHTII